MARDRVKRPAPLVNIPVVLSREELSGLDFMARSLRLDRTAVVRRALDVLAGIGPVAVADLAAVPVGDMVAGVAGVRCCVCGCSEW